MQITRTVTRLKTGETTSEKVYAITSLPPERGSPDLLLESSRGHRTIENSVHWVRDVTLGEDACAVHKDRASQTLAALRNAVLALVHLSGRSRPRPRPARPGWSWGRGLRRWPPT